MFLIESASLRFYNGDPKNIATIIRAVERLLPYVEKVFIAVRIEKDKTDAINILPGIAPGRVFTLHVSPWEDKQFSHILNGICFVAGRQHGIKQMLSVSPECIVPVSILKALAANYDDNTLAVGPVLPGHSFQEGTHEVRGSIIPWNQCNLWNMPKIMNASGFAMAGDAFWDAGNAGVEEVATYALAQQCYSSGKATVTLLKTAEHVSIQKEHFSGNIEHTKWIDESSAFGKIGTKDSRPAAQMSILPHLAPAIVRHLAL
jgi:hypothetical protein